MTGKNQILLLCTRDKPMNGKNEYDKYIKIHAAFPLTEDHLPKLFIKTFLQLSDKPYAEWEKNETELENRYEEINLFVNGDIKEFHFEEKKFFLLNFELEKTSENSKTTNNFTGFSPEVYVYFDDTYSYPVRVSTDNLKLDTMPFNFPVITKDSYPGLSLYCNMPFKMIDKKYQMIDKEGKYIGEPYKWALIIDYDFYWVGMDEINGYIDMSSGYIINKEGVKITEEGVKVEDFNICNGFIFITKNKKWGFISAKGEVCNPKFDEVKEIKEGSWVGPLEVRLGDNWGFVTKDLQFVTKEQLKAKKYDLFYYYDYIY